MRALMIAFGVVTAVVFATATSSRGDSDGSGVSSSVTESIAGSAVEPGLVTREPTHEPFTPSEYGGPPAAWSYQQLTNEEQAVADRGLNEDQTKIQDGYANATASLAAKAFTDRAALQLGLDESLEQTEVVP